MDGQTIDHIRRVGLMEDTKDALEPLGRASKFEGNERWGIPLSGPERTLPSIEGF